jgi:hypothetical protein
VAAEAEEVVAHRRLRHVQHLAPDRRHGALGVGAGSDPLGRAGDHRGGVGQQLAGDLAVRVQG